MAGLRPADDGLKAMNHLWLVWSRLLAQTEGLDRLRLSSLEPGDVDDTLLGVLIPL